MDNFINSVKSKALSVGEYLTPVLRESKFKSTGVLTPEEFVAAGDFLVHHCPTWSWSKAYDVAPRDYLPVDKQFLITKHVPCHRRCKQMQYDSNLEKIISENTGDALDEWVDTHHFAPDVNQKATDAEEAFSSGNKKAEPMEDDDDDDDGPAMDMDDFVEGGGMDQDDPYRFIPTKKEETTVGSGDNIVKTRTYDLHITYDKYYQVPRLWLLGYNEDKMYLSIPEMNEDFSEDHANKTITIEAHPHMNNVQMASIHPCRHAEVMKKLIEQLESSGKELGVHQYLLIFLKFVQAVIPTIEYDYTRSIEL